MRKAKLACLALALCASASPSVAAAQDFPSASRFQKVTLNDHPGEPIGLAVLPDGRVLHTARTGEVRIHNPRTGLNTLAADVPVYQHDEEGVQGVAIDPNFDKNRWVYLYYSPPQNTPVDVVGTGINEGDAPENLNTPADRARLALFKGDVRLSRFKLRGSTIDLDSEQQILDVPVDRGICCHVGGKIDFDGNGNLFLSTGDDTNPFQSEGYSPIDERSTRNPAFDAQRTSANTNDLRGKILRIRVKANGDYDIPSGNLFRPGTPRTRPEIYAMGFRNPFRFAVDRKSGAVYVGDYSPDANAADPLRGPAGHGRWMLIRRPGNYGWPYCVTRDIGYRDYDFATGESGEEFNCFRPVNESPNNTGRRVLPEMVQPDVWYSYPASDAGLFPELLEDRGGDGIGPMGGPAYAFNGRSRSETKWPQAFDGHPLFYEWTRDYVKVFELNRPNGNRLVDIHNLFPGGPTGIIQDNPMDMEFGPDGALYTLEYGDGFFLETPEAQLARVDFVRRGEYTPIPKVSATPTSATAPPLTVRFSSAGTSDPDGDRLSYAWDFDADGDVDSRAQNPTFTYTERGIFDATLRVSDTSGRSASASVRIVVGNQAPVVNLTVESTTPPFGFGDTVNFTVTVTDDQPVDCSRVTVAYILGHDNHGHPQTSTAGCSGSIVVPPADAGHAGQNISAVFVASYTDAPAGEEPQQGTDEVILRPGQ
jgi:cytochrome c